LKGRHKLSLKKEEIVMDGKSIRMSRLFNEETGKSVIIPIDHGAVLGNIAGLTDPVGVLKELIKLKIDATLINPGIAKITETLFASRSAPARILTADIPLFSCIPGKQEGVLQNDLLCSVEDAVRGAFDAMKVLLVYGTDKDVLIKNIKFVGNLANECDKWGMPLMVEPVLWGDRIPDDKKKDITLVENAARIALEIGADILKMPYTGDKETFSDLVKKFKVPIVILGGPKMKSTKDILEVAYDSTQAGAKGIVFGRNVWQYSDMPSLVKALQDIVHKGSRVDEVVKKYNIT